MNSWKSIKKTLEENYLADSLKGHITYYHTMYRPQNNGGTDDNFYTGNYNIKYDNEIIFKTDNKKYLDKYNCPGYDWMTQKQEMQIESSGLNIVYYKDFKEQLNNYFNMSIEDALNNEICNYKMLAIFDRRVGKRKLKELVLTYKEEPEWLQKIYEIRFKNEGINYH